jgi:hypothetical protein
MHACLLHAYDHALPNLLFIVIYHEDRSWLCARAFLSKQRSICRHAYIIHSAMLLFAL